VIAEPEADCDDVNAPKLEKRSRRPAQFTLKRAAIP
jgi:hypothetical protein